MAQVADTSFGQLMKMLMMMTLMITTVVNLSYNQVTWYTCTTSSILPCKELKPFLESYEVAFGLDSNYILIIWVLSVQLFIQAQFNKGQTGSYPEAVTLATEDARQVAKNSNSTLDWSNINFDRLVKHQF